MRLGFIVFGLLLAVPQMVLAASGRSSPHDAFSQALAKEFYCQVATTMSGDIGILIGLAISAVGFISLIFRGVSTSTLIFILSGVLLTAIPGWFEAGIDAVETITAPLESGGNQLQHKFAGKDTNCDFGSERLRPYLTMEATNPNYSQYQSIGGAATQYNGTLNNAIAIAETGNPNDYGLDHLNGAYGKYGFRMTYARDVLGMPNLTAQQFLASPSLQEQAFTNLTNRNLNHKNFGTLTNLAGQRYGASGSQAKVIAQTLAHTYGVNGGVTCMKTNVCGPKSQQHNPEGYLKRAGLIK
ncbi:MAG: hypothetical protein OXQ96_04340 [Alphaproteobacteria bacterium]|nr:hypothetical protein [Alphaproteobacteria bacterium]